MPFAILFFFRDLFILRPLIGPTVTEKENVPVSKPGVSITRSFHNQRRLTIYKEKAICLSKTKRKTIKLYFYRMKKRRRVCVIHRWAISFPGLIGGVIDHQVVHVIRMLLALMVTRKDISPNSQIQKGRSAMRTCATYHMTHGRPSWANK